MKTFTKTFALAVALCFAFFAGQIRAQDATNSADSSVSFQTFYNQLASQGTWIQSDAYGYVWQPAESDPNWRPYMYGHWVNTDAGMTWVSDETFGWATYHYGRWANLDGYGWVWVPGYTWAPAWVSWRDGDDEVGWAPLPPDSDEGIDYYDDDDYFTDTDLGFGFHIGDDCDLAYGIGPLWYSFCPIAYIGNRDCWRHFRNRGDNFALIGRTRNVTNINFSRNAGTPFGHVTAEGPSVAALNARARTPIETAQLTAASNRSNAGLRGNTLAVYAPSVDASTFETARPDSIGGTAAGAAVNRGADINRPLAVNSQVRPASPTSEQVRAATVAQRDMPASAMVATAGTRISRPLTQPLDTLRTTTRSNALDEGVRSNGESRYTGEASTASRQSSAFRGDNSFSAGEAYHPAAVYHSSEPAFRSSASAYGSEGGFERGPSVFHTSSPGYRPQSSFRSFAPSPSPHFYGGGGFHESAAHFSGGSFGGGARSVGGGGSAHASAGGSGRR
jgi:hypothetical protein